MQARSISGVRWVSRSLVFVLFLVGGVLLFLLGNNWNALFPTNRSTLYKWGLVILFLIPAIALRGNERLRGYRDVTLALLIAAFANALNWQLGNWLGRLLPPAISTAADYAIDKLAQAIPVVLSLVILNRLAGKDLGFIFLKRGDLRKGLRFGLISFAAWAVLFAFIAVWQASGPATVGLFASGVPLATIVASIPAMLVFILANSLMEELWFRGIALNRLRPLLGAAAAVVVTALVFAVAHYNATYVTALERVLFTSIVFALGMVNGFAMLRTDSIWGSVLFHAGYDLMVIIPLLVSG